MSYFKDIETEFEDEACTAEAATAACGKKIEVLSKPRLLKGWGRASAEIIIPRGAVGNHYEIGFAKQTNGKYKLIAADDDLHKVDMNKLKREYGAAKTVHMAKAKGMKLSRLPEETVDQKTGRINIRMYFAAVQAGAC